MSKKNDIALIEFGDAIEFNDYVRPACIGIGTEDFSETDNLVITGWGSIEADRKSKAFLSKHFFSLFFDPNNRLNQSLIDLIDLISTRFYTFNPSKLIQLTYKYLIKRNKSFRSAAEGICKPSAIGKM